MTVVARWRPFLAPALPVLAVGFALAGWFGDRAAALALLGLFGVMALARGAHGRWPVPVVARWPLLGLVAALPVALTPVVAWSVAMPRLLAVAINLLAFLVVATSLTPTQVGAWRIGLVAAVLGGMALLSPWLVDWQVAKTAVLPFVDVVVERFPLALQGAIVGTPRGGIHPNQLAGVLALVLPVGVALTLGERRGRVRLLIGATVVIGALAVALTQSRAGYIAAVVGVLAVAGLVGVPVWRGRSPIALAIYLGVTMLALGAAGALLVQWVTTADATLASFGSRQELWQRAVLLLTLMPVTGVGLGQVSLVVDRLAPTVVTPPEAVIVHVHNGFLQLALDLGLPGALAALSLIAVIGWRLARQYWAGDRLAASGLLSGLLAFGVFNLVDAIAITARGALVVWIALAIALATTTVAPRSRTTGTPALTPPETVPTR